MDMGYYVRQALSTMGRMLVTSDRAVFARLDAQDARFDAIQNQLSVLATQGARIMSAADDLKAAIEQEKTLEQSAITLIQGLTAKLASAQAPDGSISAEAAQELIREVNSNTTQLAAALVANTPAAATPVADPAPATPAADTSPAPASDADGSSTGTTDPAASTPAA